MARDDEYPPDYGKTTLMGKVFLWTLFLGGIFLIVFELVLWLCRR